VVTLAERISSFRDLPVLLAEAQALGTNILYLICPGSGNQSSFQRPAAFGQNVVHTWLSNPYMRVSSESDRQITDLQRDALLAAGVDGRHLVAFRPDWIRALIPRNIDASSRILVLRRY